MLRVRGPGNVSSLEVWEFKWREETRRCGNPGGEKYEKYEKHLALINLYYRSYKHCDSALLAC